jgi:hypothetical protein
MSDLERLRQLQTAVVPLAEAVSLRGEGQAAFLFVEGKGRAVEAGRTGGRRWLEFWNGGEDEVSPAKELTVDTDEEALSEIADWLR